MSESKTEVLSINVEILGRRLSLTLEEARVLQVVLRDALGDISSKNPVREFVPIYPSCSPCQPCFNRPYYWEYQTICDNSDTLTFSSNGGSLNSTATISDK